MWIGRHACPMCLHMQKPCTQPENFPLCLQPFLTEKKEARISLSHTSKTFSFNELVSFSPSYTQVQSKETGL